MEITDTNLDIVPEEKEETPVRSPHKPKKLVVDREYIRAKMTEFVNGIDDQFKFILTSHEKDFVSAY